MVNREEMYEFLVEFPDRLKDDTDDDLQDLKKENQKLKDQLHAHVSQHEVDAKCIAKLKEELIKVKDCFREHAQQAVSQVSLISKLTAENKALTHALARAESDIDVHAHTIRDLRDLTNRLQGKLNLAISAVGV